MKKGLAICLALILCLSVVGCMQAETPEPPESGKTVGESPNAPEPTSGGEPAKTDEAVDSAKPLEGVRILQLCNTRGDGGLHDNAAEGVSRLADEYGAEIKQVEMGNSSADVTKYLPTLLDACEEGWDYIVCGSSQMLDPVKQAATEYPDQKIIIFDVEITRENPGDYANVYSCVFKQNEASFLAGAMAMAMSDTGTIGFIGGMEITVINDFLVGYIDGARYVNPDAQVLHAYVGDWNDLAKAKELANVQYQMGASCIFPAAGQCFSGIFETGHDQGKYYIGCDQDRALKYETTNPEINDYLLTSVLKLPGNAIVKVFERIIAGEKVFGQHESLGLKEGSVGLAQNEYYEKLVPADIRETLDEISAKIVSGEIVVKTMYGMTQEEFNEFRG
ncbi:MAG TPA: BMP family ABC transporter substrate-binding protein [Clostridia bacterium]|nr:BMP family ABC transporter substrate-binding protein [Clostridia bacterium]